MSFIKTVKYSHYDREDGDGPYRFPQRHTMSLRRILWRLGAVVKYELLLQSRSMTFWMASLLLTIIASAVALLMAFSQVSGASDTNQNSITFSYLLSILVYFILPLLLMRTFARDHQRKVTSLLWMRPLSSTEYALGKGVAATCMSIMLGGVPFVVGWLCIWVVRGVMPSLQLWLTLLAMLLASSILIAWFTLLFLSLFPRPLLGALLVAFIVLLPNFLLPDTLLGLPRLNLQVVVYTRSLGFGPDALPVLYRILCIASLAIACLGLFSLIFSWREKQGLTLRRHLISPIVLFLVGSILLFPLLLSFGKLAATYQDVGPIQGPPQKATTDQYHLQATVDPQSGTVKGNASFVVRPQQSGDQDFSFALDAGLRIQQIQVNGANTSFRTNRGWTQVNLTQTPFAQGTPVQIALHYDGTLTLDRREYGNIYSGISSADSPFTGLKYLSYAGQGMAFLQGYAGFWYPLPWTEQAVIRQLRPVVDVMDLRFPVTMTAMSSLGTFKRSRDGQWQELIAEPRGILPDAVAAAFAHPHQATLGTQTHLYANGANELPQQTVPDYIGQPLSDLEQWLHPQQPITRWTVVIVPFLSLPVVGSGLVFYPENLDIPMSSSSDKASEAVNYRENGIPVIQAWWNNVLPIQVIYNGADKGKPFAMLGKNAYYENGISTLLAQYSAVFLTDQLKRPGFLELEQQACQDPNGAISPQLYASVGSPFCDSSMQVFYRLGKEKTTRFLQQYVQQHAGQPMTQGTFFSAVSNVQK